MLELAEKDGHNPKCKEQKLAKKHVALDIWGLLCKPSTSHCLLLLGQNRPATVDSVIDECPK